MKRQKGVSAWLITWEWSGHHAKPARKVEDILSPRTSSARVREVVELLYHREARLAEKVDWRPRKGSHKPYAAEFQRIDGVPWEGEIICGHNPHLRARLVDNLIIGTDAKGKETASWKDRFTVREMTQKIRRLHGKPTTRAV